TFHLNIQQLYDTIASIPDTSTKRDAATNVSIKLDNVASVKKNYATKQPKLIESYVKAQADLIFRQRRNAYRLQPETAARNLTRLHELYDRFKFDLETVLNHYNNAIKAIIIGDKKIAAQFKNYANSIHTN
ncbi:hypothetical protein L0F63_007024, partial [Massospora cicadina]